MKATSKAEAKRKRRGARKAPPGIPSLAAAPAREPNGRTQRDGGKNPREVALRSRAKRAGFDPDSEADRKIVKDPIYEDGHGNALASILSAPEAKRRHRVWVALCAAEERYGRLKIGRKMGADNYAREIAPDPVEVGPDDGPDLRDPEEKLEAATRAWVTWRARVELLDPAHSGVIDRQLGKTGSAVFVGRNPEIVGFADLPISAQRLVAGLACGSSGPLAKAIARAASKVEPSQIEEVRELPGRGIEGIWRGQTIRMGRADWVGAYGEGSTRTKAWLRLGDAPAVAIQFSTRFPSRVTEEGHLWVAAMGALADVVDA